MVQSMLSLYSESQLWVIQQKEIVLKFEMTLVFTSYLYTSWVSSLCKKKKKGHIGGRVSDHCLKNFVSKKDPSYANNTEQTKTWAIQSPLW